MRVQNSWFWVGIFFSVAVQWRVARTHTYEQQQNNRPVRPSVAAGRPKQVNRMPCQVTLAFFLRKHWQTWCSSKKSARMWGIIDRDITMKDQGLDWTFGHLAACKILSGRYCLYRVHPPSSHTSQIYNWCPVDYAFTNFTSVRTGNFFRSFITKSRCLCNLCVAVYAFICNISVYVLRSLLCWLISYRSQLIVSCCLILTSLLSSLGNREMPSNRNVEYRVLTGLGKAE